MALAHLQRKASWQPRATLDDTEFQRLKRDDFLRPSALIALACAFLVFALWLWDWAIDARHAPQTLWLRIVLSASLLAYPLAIWAGTRRWLPLVFYGMLIWLELVFLRILQQLDGGAVHGVAGFTYWFIVPPLMSFVLRLRDNVLGNLAVVACPSVLAGPFGQLPEMNLAHLNALIVPACGITIVGHVMIDRLLRRIYDYRWQLEWRSVAIDALAEGVVIIQDGVIRYANPAAAAQVGRRPAEIVGTPLADYVHVDGKTDLARPLRIEAPGGRPAWVRVARAATAWQGRQATLVSVTDVTEELHAEEALRGSEERYRSLVDHASEGILISQNGILRYVNPRVAEMAGRTEAELVGKPLLEFVHAEDHAVLIERQRRRLRGGAVPLHEEFRLLRADGTLLCVEFSSVDVEWEGESAILTFLIDVTARKQAEADVRAALEKQTELNQLKSRFVSMTSHEFRTPLAAILSSAELLKYYGDRLPAGEQSEIVDSIGQAVRRMTHMLDDILAIGRAEADRLDFAPTRLDVRTLCAEVAGEALRAAQAEGRRGARIDFVMAGGEVEAMLDGKLMRHILGNLLSNGLKYSPDGQPVQLTVEAEPGTLRFIVADRGIGIPAEDLPRLFETFHRARNVGNISGTGLGLAIVKKALQLHGGRIEVDSRPGVGSRFVVTLDRTP